MGALNSFVAAARQASFSKAGSEVGLTQSAVSRQIALLEDWVETPPFDRVGRGVELNANGRAYADIIGSALDRIRGATARLLDRRPDTELTIATLPSFGMRWLAPRLPRFTAEHPELVVNFAARAFPFDFAGEEFDAAIHFGASNWPGVSHDFLFREEAIPVCAPDWLRRHPILEPADMLTQTLLLQVDRKDAWTRWFRHVGVDREISATGATFEHFLMLAQAAAAGAGVALMPRFLIEPELAAGTFVMPLHLPLTTEDAYYLVVLDDSPPKRALTAFRRWIRNEACLT